LIDQAARLGEPLNDPFLLFTALSGVFWAKFFAFNGPAALLSYRSNCLWQTGYPAQALADMKQAITEARDITHAATLMNVLAFAGLIYLFRGDFAETNAVTDELVSLAEEKNSSPYKAFGILEGGILLLLTGDAEAAIRIIRSVLTSLRLMGMTLYSPLGLSCLAGACAKLGEFDDAWRRIGEAMTAMDSIKETWFEAEVNRAAGEIALMSPTPDTAKAEAYFERALAVALAQQAKSWELRAAMSMPET
jgi:predicted ATPase